MGHVARREKIKIAYNMPIAKSEEKSNERLDLKLI
jgi:hypothetical protein